MYVEKEVNKIHHLTVQSYPYSNNIKMIYYNFFVALCLLNLGQLFIFRSLVNNFR